MNGYIDTRLRKFIGSGQNTFSVEIFRCHTLRRTIITLTKQLLKRIRYRRAAVSGVWILIALSVCTSALAMRVRVAEQSSGPAPQSMRPPRRVRVSGGVMAANNLSKVDPVYPAEARAAGVSGTVVLHAIIGKDGSVQSVTVVAGPAVLQASALDAVRQWTYKPFLLNGEPVEVDTTITLNYSLNN